MNPDEKLEKLLNQWQPSCKPDPMLAERVEDQIEMLESARKPSFLAPFAEWLRGVTASPAYAGGLAVILVVCGIGISQIWKGSTHHSAEQLSSIYRLSIDPVYRLEASAEEARHAAEAALMAGLPLNESLVWLQGELDLDKGQYSVFIDLHTQYRESFDELFGELVELRRGYQKFEKDRKQDDVIDFMALYDLLQKQKQLREMSEELTRELLIKAAEIMEPEQKERFERMFNGPSPDLEARAATTANA